MRKLGGFAARLIRNSKHYAARDEASVCYRGLFQDNRPETGAAHVDARAPASVSWPHDRPDAIRTSGVQLSNAPALLCQPKKPETMHPQTKLTEAIAPQEGKQKEFYRPDGRERTRATCLHHEARRPPKPCLVVCVG